MMSKKNQMNQLRRHQSRQPRFALKKLSVGVASVIIGFTYLGVSGVAHADAQVPADGAPNVAIGQSVTPGNHSAAQVTLTKPMPTATKDQNQELPALPARNHGQKAAPAVTTPVPAKAETSPTPASPARATAPVTSAQPVATPDNAQPVEVNDLQAYWIGHDGSTPMDYITNFRALKNVADVTWDLPQLLQARNDAPGMLNVKIQVLYQDGTTTLKDLTLAAYTKSVILKFVDANTGQPFPMHYSQQMMDWFKLRVWGFVPSGGTFHVAPVQYQSDGVGSVEDSEKFIPIQPGYAVAKVTLGSLTGPELAVTAIPFTEYPATYYIQLARFKEIQVKGVDEAGHLLYQYLLPTDQALAAPVTPGYYDWEGDQYSTNALTVPNYTLDQSRLPTNATGNLNGAPDQLQSGQDTTINVTYVYRFNGAPGAGTDSELQVTNPLILRPTPDDQLALGVQVPTNAAYNITSQVDQAIQQSQARGMVVLGEVGRNVGVAPYLDMTVQLNRVPQGNYQILVKVDGRVVQTVPVTGMVGPTYDLTNQVARVKQQYGRYQLVSVQGVPLTGRQSPFNQTVILNYTRPTETQTKVVTRTIREKNPRTGVIKTVNVQTVEFSRQVTLDPDSREVVATTEWHPVTVAIFTNYLASVIPGYTPQPVDVQDQLVTATTADQDILITYRADPQTVVVRFQTTAGQLVAQQVVKGVTDQTINLASATQFPAGYHLVGKDPRGELTLGVTNPTVVVLVAKDTPPAGPDARPEQPQLPGTPGRAQAVVPPVAVTAVPTGTENQNSQAGDRVAAGAGNSVVSEARQAAHVNSRLPQTGDQQSLALVGLGLLGGLFAFLGLKKRSE